MGRLPRAHAGTEAECLTPYRSRIFKYQDGHVRGTYSGSRLITTKAESLTPYCVRHSNTKTGAYVRKNLHRQSADDNKSRQPSCLPTCQASWVSTEARSTDSVLRTPSSPPHCHASNKARFVQKSSRMFVRATTKQTAVVDKCLTPAQATHYYSAKTGRAPFGKVT